MTKLGSFHNTHTHTHTHTHTQICHPSGAALLNKFLKNSEVVMIKDCGHTIALERPKKTASIIANFISRNLSTYSGDNKDD